MREHLTEANAVFAGGGVKGVGLVGALNYAMETGVRWRAVGGTSAGAIVAALLAAGYSAEELRRAFIDELEPRCVRDRNWLNYIPLVGDYLNLYLYAGIYKDGWLTSWITEHLARKGVYTFADLDRATGMVLKVVAADITNKRLLILPDDLPLYRIDPRGFSVAEAVRMSIALPVYFRPYRLGDAVIVDGGILSNFPLWLFNGDEVHGKRPTIGFRLVDAERSQGNRVSGVTTYLKAVINTMQDAHDLQQLEEDTSSRCILVPTLGISTTDFSVNRDRLTDLYHAGYDAARLFFKLLDFETYLSHYRSGSASSRRRPPGADAPAP